jgi:hypothetical protein
MAGVWFDAADILRSTNIRGRPYLYPPLGETHSLSQRASQTNPLAKFVRHMQKLNLVDGFVDGPVWAALRSAAFANAEVSESQKLPEPKSQLELCLRVRGT